MRAWENFLKNQEKELGKETVNKWLRSLQILHFDACNLYLEAKDAFQMMWFEEHIRKKLKTELINNNNKQVKVHLSTANGTLSAPNQTKTNSKKRGNPDEQQKIAFHFDALDPIKTFDNFIVSESNLLAYKLLCKVTNYDSVSKTFIASDKDLASFNPIFLFGGEGTGKTHLMMATAHALKSRELKVIYVRAETFTEHVVSAIRAGEMSAFRQAYRNIDILIIDDVEVLSRKGATQEELFHTFNTLHLSGKQIILSANCAPSELQYIEPRLISRFEWGIVLPLEPLNEQDVQKVLLQKIEAMNAPIHPKVTEFLLSTFKNSVKSLTGALEALLLRHHMNAEQQNRSKAPINPQVARLLLKDLIEEEQKEALTTDRVIHIVAEYFGIKTEDIFSKSQSRECVLPRQFAMYFCRDRLKMPYKKIGEQFSRDHSTVMSSVKVIENGIKNQDKELCPPYNSIQKMLNR